MRAYRRGDSERNRRPDSDRARRRERSASAAIAASPGSTNSTPSDLAGRPPLSSGRHGRSLGPIVLLWPGGPSTAPGQGGRAFCPRWSGVWTGPVGGGGLGTVVGEAVGGSVSLALGVGTTPPLGRGDPGADGFGAPLGPTLDAGVADGPADGAPLGWPGAVGLALGRDDAPGPDDAPVPDEGTTAVSPVGDGVGDADGDGMGPVGPTGGLTGDGLGPTLAPGCTGDDEGAGEAAAASVGRLGDGGTSPEPPIRETVTPIPRRARLTTPRATTSRIRCADDTTMEMPPAVRSATSRTCAPGRMVAERSGRACSLNRPTAPRGAVRSGPVRPRRGSRTA